jgi:hypothetical protein
MLIQIEEPSERPAEDGVAAGIDFGATGLRIALSAGGNGEVLSGPDGTDFVPAVVTIGADGRLAVGAATDETGTAISNLRSLLGGGPPLLPAGPPRSAADLAAEVLELIKVRGEAVLGRNVTRAVVTVLPELDQTGRIELMAAIDQAGIELLLLLDDPIAIGLGAGLERCGGPVAILELGPSAFAATVLVPEAGRLVLAGRVSDAAAGRRAEQALLAGMARGADAVVSLHRQLETADLPPPKELPAELADITAALLSRAAAAADVALDRLSGAALAGPFAVWFTDTLAARLPCPVLATPAGRGAAAIGAAILAEELAAG